jgi:hypothetical protein
MQSKATAAMAGLVAAGLASWDRIDNDTRRKLRENREDANDALDQIAAYKSSGEQVRGRLPIVMDAQIGLALANPAQISPEILPTTTKLTRPAFDEESVSDLNWPPKTGTYDAKHRVSEIGEMTRTFLAMTFQEVRAFIEGLAQSKSPTQAGLLQINRAANQLVSVLSTLNLSTAQYAAAWQKVFGAPSTTVSDPHLGTPVIGAPNGGNNVASVAFLVSSVKNDRAMRIRITAGVGNISATTDIVTVTFASEWKDASGNPIIPSLVASQGLFASGISSTGFTLQSEQSILGGMSKDFSIIVSGGASANTIT